MFKLVIYFSLLLMQLLPAACLPLAFDKQARASIAEGMVCASFRSQVNACGGFMLGAGQNDLFGQPPVERCTDGRTDAVMYRPRQTRHLNSIHPHLAKTDHFFVVASNCKAHNNNNNKRNFYVRPVRQP